MSKQWIAVANEKPEIDGLNVSIDCLVKSNGESFKGFYHYRNECWYCLEPPFVKDHFRKLENVTHWRHISNAPATPLPQTEVGDALKAIDQELLWHQVVNFFQGEYVNNTHTTKEEIIRDLMQHYTITKKQ